MSADQTQIISGGGPSLNALATEMRRSGKEDMASFERDGVRPRMKDVKRETFSGTKFVSRESVSNRVRSQAKAEDGVQVSKSEKRFSSVSLPRRLLRTSVAPILSLKRVRITKASTGHFVVFLLRVAALEAIRRVSTNRCPQIWWGLQGISLLQAPPFSWFLRWAPLRQLVEGTQSFSKPLIVLSIATAVSSAVEEFQHVSEPNVLERVLAPPQEPQEERTPAVPETSEMHTMNTLKLALEQGGIDLPERFGDDELENFLVGSNGNLQRFVTRVQKSVKWRQTYYFLNSQELKQWSHFVSWHNLDSKSRPTLIIRLGPAYTSLQADERPLFCQAVVSQVEYGVLHLLNADDPRITVIMDCKGTTAMGFPVHMMKSCAVLVQDNYPTRLAALFVVNLPTVVRFVASAVMQVVSEVTRQKVHLLGDVFLTALSEHVGGTDKVQALLGGACHCSDCMEDRTSSGVHQVSVDRTPLGIRHRNEELAEETAERTYEESLLTNYQSSSAVLRVAIIFVLMLWVLLVVGAGLPEPDFLST